MTTRIVPQGTMAQALSAVLPTITVSPTPKFVYTPRNIDPVEFIKQEVHSDYAKARMLSYMAWMMDNTLSQAITTFFFALLRGIQESSSNESITNYYDFLKVMSVRKAAAENLYEQGFVEADEVKLIQQLMVLRIDWHDTAYAAQRALSLTSVTSRYPSIEQVLRNLRPQETDSIKRAKFKALAEYDAGDNAAPELVQEYYDAYMLRDQQANEDRFARAKERVDALVSIAGYFEDTNLLTDVTFNDLPKDVRRRLVECASRACETGIKELITNRKVPVEDMVPGKKLLKRSQEQLEALVIQFDEPSALREHSGSESEFEDAHLNAPGLLGTHGHPSPMKHDQRQEITATN